MKPILYLRSKSDSFMNFLKKKRENHKELLMKGSSFCDSCEEIILQLKKLHKCNSCGKRNICNECHIEHKDICIYCNETVTSLYNNIEKTFGNTHKYNFGSDNEESFEDLEGLLI